MKDEQSFSPQNQSPGDATPNPEFEQTTNPEPQAYGFGEQQSSSSEPIENTPSETEVTATPLFDSEPATSPSTATSASDTTQSFEQQSTPDSSEPSVIPLAPPAAAPFGPSPVQGPVVVEGKPKSSKKKFFIIGSVITALLLLGGGTAAAYSLWYQNPDKVIGDALVNAMQAKTVAYTGSFDLKMDDSSSPVSTFKFEVFGKGTRSASQLDAKLTFDYEDEKYAISGAALTAENGDVFLKANDVEEQLTKMLEASDSSYGEIPVYITDIIDKIDNKWVRISADDLKEYDDSHGETQKCVTDTVKRIEGDKATISEVVELYKNNKFIVVKEKLGSVDGSLGYVIDGDETKAKSFVDSLKDTKIMKELQKCDDAFEFDFEDLFDSSSSSNSDGTSRLEIWVDRWSHQVTKLQLEGSSDDSEGKLVVEPRINEAVSVESPKDFVALKDLIADIEDAMKQYQSELYGSYGLDSADFSDLETRSLSGSTEL